MKVALYVRVSKDEASSDGRLQDPENQLIPLRKYVEAMEWSIQGEYVDKASGGNSNRPEFQRMLSEVRQGHVQLVLVWALDRFSREGMGNTLGYIKQLKTYNCALQSLQESWLNTRNEGVNDLLLAIFAWVAAEERKRISDRTKAALTKLKEKGVKLGRPWHKIKDPLKDKAEKEEKPIAV